MKKVDKSKRDDPNLKVENMVQADLEVIYLNNIQGKFTIQTMDVELFRDTEMFGEMDPYIILKIGKDIYTTKAKDNQGKHCTWTERIELKVTSSGNHILALRVYDKDPMKDDLVCTGEIPMLKEGLLVPSEKPKERQFSLFFNNAIAGTIKLEYIFEMVPFNY
jgi:Ca2+-dependent lipid-binding protein